VLIPSPCVKTTPEPFTIKVRRPHVLVFSTFSSNKRWWRLRVPSSLGRRTHESRVALPPKGRLRQAEITWYTNLEASWIHSWKDLMGVSSGSINTTPTWLPTEHNCKTCARRSMSLSRSTPKGGGIWQPK